ncbi:hypothetical protein PG994_013972 [Apiospora phragmitis]|uniref:Uncharacterized protein n=1 Tax=Apiospora phragmitis TaxID=2905665 RepID=A0ABR1T2X3_9PEZI
MDSDEDLAVIRRFGDLYLLNILVVQAELQKMRAEFIAMCEDPSKAGHRSNIMSLPVEGDGVDT